MPQNLQFTDDELAQLHLLVAQELESSHIELHHTAGVDYRNYIKARLTRCQALLKKIDDAIPGLSKRPKP